MLMELVNVRSVIFPRIESIMQVISSGLVDSKPQVILRTQRGNLENQNPHRNLIGVELCNIRRSYVQTLARIASQLLRRFKEPHANLLETLQEDKFHPLDSPKNKLISPLVLSVQNKTGHYTSDTNACGKQEGLVFLPDQSDGRTARPKENWSQTIIIKERKLNTAQTDHFVVF